MGKKPEVSIFDIQKKIQGRVKACALCGSGHWQLEPDLYNLRLQSPWGGREGKLVKCAILTCSECGNMHVINIHAMQGGQKQKVNAKKKEKDTVELADMQTDEEIEDTEYVISEDD